MGGGGFGVLGFAFEEDLKRIEMYDCVTTDDEAEDADVFEDVDWRIILRASHYPEIWIRSTLR